LQADQEKHRRAMTERHRQQTVFSAWSLGDDPAGESALPDIRHRFVALHCRQWDRCLLKPHRGSATDRQWQPEYPVWIGADKELSESPLAFPGKVQVTGHVRVSKPDVTPIRIRLDTSGGFGDLTACLLRSADA
jgi:hypothetical protein